MRVKKALKQDEKAAYSPPTSAEENQARQGNKMPWASGTSSIEKGPEGVHNIVLY